MTLPKGLIIRTVGEYTHILNPYSSKIVTLSNHDFKNLPDTDSDEIDKEILETFQITKTDISSREFRSKLVDLGPEFNFPTIVNIEITRRCVLDCKHCYITSEEHKSSEIKGIENLSKKEVEDLIKQIHDMGIFLIVLTGGEPLISKNLSYFLNACKKYDMLIEIFSSLQIIPDEIAEYKKNGYKIARIQVSIYSLKNSVHDDITRKSGSLERSLKNIDKLKGLGLYIEAATPLMKLNYNDRHELKNYFNKKKVYQDFSWPIFNEYYSERTNKSDLNISKEKLLTYMQENPDYLITCEYNDENSPLCVAGISVFSIAADGSVFPCSQYPRIVGNIFLTKETLKEIYLGKRMKDSVKYRVKDLCKDCKSYNFCIGNNYSETGDPLKQPVFMKDALEYCAENLKKGGVKYDKSNKK